MKIYLAARYSRRGELRFYADELRKVGYQVTSRWLDGSHRLDADGLSEQAAKGERQRFAEEDWSDLMAADLCISFTEPPRASNSRGGRHVEFGAALAAGKRCVVIGEEENVFHCLPAVQRYESWIDFLEAGRAAAV